MMADQDNKIEVTIVLDDGSVQRGFIRMEQQAKATADKMGSEFKTIGDVLNADVLGQVTNKIKSIPIAFAGTAIAILAVGAAVKEAFDLTIEGEKIAAAENQFKSFAESAGISAQSLKHGLEESANGLIDTTTLLKEATSSIINLGKGAERLPEVLELARQATRALGGSLEERFSAITTAIETGNQKALKNQGIILDVNKAYRDYGLTLGVSGGSLSKAQQQQALLNAVLDQGGEKFKNATANINPNTVALKQIGVALHETGEEFAKFINSKFGQSFAEITQAAANFLREFNRNNSSEKMTQLSVGTEKVTEKLKELRAEAAKIQSEIIFQESTGGKGSGTKIQRLKEDLADLQPALYSAELQLELFNKAIQRNQEKPPEKPAGEDPLALTDQQKSEIFKRHQAILQAQLEAQKAEVAAKAEHNATLAGLDEGRARDVATHNEILKNLETEKNLQLEAIRNQNENDKTIDLNERRQLEASIIKKYDAQVLSENTKFTEAQKKTYKTLGSVAREVFSGELGSAFQAFGKALHDGADAGQAFGDAMVGIFGDIAIQLGNFYIAKGIALSADPLTPGSGAGLIAAGAALNVLGGVLKASAGKSGAGGGGVAGGETSVPSSGISSAPDKLEERKPETKIEVNIAGDVLDSHETGIRIVDLINNAFDQNGVVVTGRAV
jgi:hypothetical protein